MSHPLEGGRLYDEAEVGRLLRRAAEIDARNDSSRTVGLSLAEIQRVASDAGIDPEAVAAAATELEGPDGPGDETNVWGGPVSLALKRSVKAEVSQDVWESMVAEMRRVYKEPGVVSQRENVMEWSLAGRELTVHLAVTRKSETSRIDLFWNQPILAAPVYAISSFIGIVGGLGIVANLGLATLESSFLFAGILGTVFLVARWTLSRLSARQKEKLRDVMGRLEDMARKSGPAVDSVAWSGEPAGLSGQQSAEDVQPGAGLLADEPIADPDRTDTAGVGRRNRTR